MSHKEKTLSSKTMFSGRIFDVQVDEVVLENGKIDKREVCVHDGGVCVLALTKDEELYFVKQYRYPFQQEMLELPAGRLEHNESPKKGAMRELKEEVGLIAHSWYPLTIMLSSPGCFTEEVYCYLATDLEEVDQELDENEFLDVYKVPLLQALDMIAKGQLLDAKTQLSILTYMQMRTTMLQEAEMERQEIETNNEEFYEDMFTEETTTDEQKEPTDLSEETKKENTPSCETSTSSDTVTPDVFDATKTVIEDHNLNIPPIIEKETTEDTILPLSLEGTLVEEDILQEILSSLQ